MGTLTNSGATTVASEQDAQKVVTINTMAQILDDMLGGSLTLTTTGGTTTLTGTSVAPQAQHMLFTVAGVLASNAVIEIPVAAGTGRPRLFIVKNSTTGAFTLTVRAVGQTGVVITQGKARFLFYDGTDIAYAAPVADIALGPSDSPTFAGMVLTGALLAQQLTTTRYAEWALRMQTTSAATSNTTHKPSPVAEWQGSIWNGAAAVSKFIEAQLLGVSGQNSQYYLEIASSDVANILYIRGDNGQVAIGTASPNAAAQFQVDSTTKGWLPPRMTTTQKNAISSPPEGLEVYDLTLHKKCVYTGSAWETITSV